MVQKAVFAFELGEARNAAVLAAIQPEASRDIPRASARVWKDGPLLYLEIRAEDPFSLRAAVNSYLRWVKVAAEAAGMGQAAGEGGAEGERAAGTRRPARRTEGAGGRVPAGEGIAASTVKGEVAGGRKSKVKVKKKGK